VFLDIRMPVLDGVETVKLIQGNALWEQVKVIAVSASVLEHERREFLESGFDDFLDKPFRFERVCECLGKHLGVEFEYGEQAQAMPMPKGEAAAWKEIALPEELHAKLQEAAELYSVTELENYFNDLENLGEGPQKLAAHLRDLRRKHDIDAILQVLQELKRR
jgi:CheY-like chemotaxis protein